MPSYLTAQPEGSRSLQHQPIKAASGASGCAGATARCSASTGPQAEKAGFLKQLGCLTKKRSRSPHSGAVQLRPAAGARIWSRRLAGRGLRPVMALLDPKGALWVSVISQFAAESRVSAALRQPVEACGCAPPRSAKSPTTRLSKGRSSERTVSPALIGAAFFNHRGQ